MSQDHKFVKTYSTGKIVHLKKEHVPELLESITKEDLFELANIHPHPDTYVQYLESMLAGAIRKYTVLNNDNQVVAIFGILPSGVPKVGIGFMLTSTRLCGNIAYEFLRKCKAIVSQMIEETELYMIYNYVPRQFKKHKKWLKYAGFSIESNPIRFGHYQTQYQSLYICK